MTMKTVNLCVYGDDVVFDVDDFTYNIFEKFYDAIPNSHIEVTPYSAWNLCDRGIYQIPKGYGGHFDYIENYITSIEESIDDYLTRNNINSEEYRKELYKKCMEFLDIQILGVPEWRRITNYN